MGSISDQNSSTVTVCVKHVAAYRAHSELSKLTFGNAVVPIHVAHSRKV
jgi:hypothetical protein